MSSLADLCTHIIDCEHKTAPASPDGGCYCPGTRDIKNGRLLLDRAKRVDEETYELWTRRLEPKADDIILAREAPVGEAATIPAGVRVCLGQRTVLLRPDPTRVVPRYLLYMLLSPSAQHAMTSRAEGSTVPHLNVSDIRALPLTVAHDLDEQKLIADTLGALDEKVELNGRMLTTLEALLEAQFDVCCPPDSTSATPATLADLGAVRGGGTPKTKESAYWDPPELRWATPTDLTGLQGPVLTTTARGISALGLEKSSAQVNPRGTVLMTSRATIGLTAVAAEALSTNQGFINVQPRSDLSSALVLLMLRRYMEDIKSRANGSTFLEVNKTNFKAVPVMLPAPDEREAFDLVAAPILTKVESLHRQNDTLRALRDTLLPLSFRAAVLADDAGELQPEAVSA